MWKYICKKCSRHNIAEILLKLALNDNLPIHQIRIVLFEKKSVSKQIHCRGI